MIDGKYRVEFADLYRNDTLFFVKIDSSQKMAYVVDQSMNTLAVVQNNAWIVTVSDNKVRINGY